MPDRDQVFDAIWAALAPLGLDGYTDGCMDALDTVITWPDEEDDE